MFSAILRRLISSIRHQGRRAPFAPAASACVLIESLEQRVNLDAYIDIEGVHVDITLPEYDDQGVLIGYVNYSYGPTSDDYFGGRGAVTVKPYPADWDPENHHDYVIDTLPYQDALMTAAAQALVDNPPDYNLLLGSTCVGQTTAILQAGEISGPWYVGDPWTGHGYDDWLEDWIDGVTPLNDQDVEGTGSSSADDSSGVSGGGNDSGSSGGENVPAPPPAPMPPPVLPTTTRVNPWIRYPDGTMHNTETGATYLGPGPKY
jgi:hypothetical protein